MFDPIKTIARTLAGAALCAAVSVGPAEAALVSTGQSVRIDFLSTTGTPPFDFVTLGLSFSAGNPFGTNETLHLATFDGAGTALRSETVASGSSVFTSGFGATLTLNAINPFSLATALTTPDFYATVTAVSGSFDLVGAQANFQHVFTAGVNEFAVPGTIGAVPEPATWAMMLLGFAGLGIAQARRRRAYA